MVRVKVEQSPGQTTFRYCDDFRGAHGRDGYIKTETPNCLYSSNKITIDGKTYNKNSLINFLREDCKNKKIDSKIKKGFLGFGSTSDAKIAARFRQNLEFNKKVNWV